MNMRKISYVIVDNIDSIDDSDECKIIFNKKLINIIKIMENIDNE